MGKMQGEWYTEEKKENKAKPGFKTKKKHREGEENVLSEKERRREEMVKMNNI